MSFANLTGLLWLAPLGGIIVVMYLLKMRRKDMRVPATFLWPAMTYEIRANALFQRLRFSWLLVLQLIALALVVTAFARPQLRQMGLGGEVTVLVLDTSASMSATDVKPSRFAEGIKVCRSVIEAVRPGDRVSLIEAGPSPRVVFPLSGDAAKMRRTLDSVQATDGESDVGEALRLAASVAAKERGARIILISDGDFEDVQNFAPGNAQVVFHKIGEETRNVAITALGIGDSPSGRLLYCGLKNYGLDAAKGKLNLYADGKLFNSFTVNVKAKGTTGQNATAPPNAKVFEARIDFDKDELAADNYAVTLSDPGASIKVLLVGESDLFMERALSLDPRVTLDRAPSVPKNADYDIIVFDGVPESRVKARGVITFGRSGPGSPVIRTGPLKDPRITNQETDHPLMNAVDFGETYIGEAEQVQVRPEGEVLAQSGNNAMVVVSQGTQKHVYVAFEPMKSDFPLQVSFPIFLSNAIDYLIPPNSRGQTLAVSAGRTFALPAFNANEPMNMKSPDGSSERIAASGGSYAIRDIKKVGEYELNVGNVKRKVYASLISDVESNINPTDKVILGRSTVAKSSSISRLADYWRPLLLCCLLVLAGEWWLFARRS